MLDRRQSHAEVLTLIARCGRASPTWQTGKLGVIWDDEGRPATALVTPGNIVAGTFRVEYAAGRTAEEIAVRYIEPELDWQYNTLRRTVPDAGAHPSSTATITLHGVTGRAQAAMACNLQAARQLYHRRRLTWEMAAEGLSLARGDVVTITHSLIDGGAAGRLAGGTAARVRLDRSVNPGAGGQLLLRLLDGTVHQSAVSRPPGSEAGEVDELVLASPLPLAPGAGGDNPRDILWRLYDDALPPVRARIIAVRPSSERRVRFTAIDETEAYYRLATGDLSAPFPQPVSRAPRVLGVSFAARRVRVGRGFMVELEATLTVAGDWRGATVRAGPGFERLAAVDRLVDGATVARWLVPPDTGQAVEIVPGTEAAPAGPRFRAAWMLELPLPPAAPADFAVREADDGTRVYSWTPPEAPDLEGVLIRYAADARAAWADMTPLHAGFLTASPFETLEPAPGTYTFAARAVSTAGLESESATVRATLGSQRIGGQRWHVGTGPPDAALGAERDLYLDAGASTIWRKAGGAWSQIADFSGADGATWYSGAGVPAAALGADGDWYFRTATAGIYRKIAGAWVFQLDIDGEDGATWHAGAGAPAPNLGTVGDFYFRTSNGFVYEKIAAAVWTFRHDLTGPQGIAGATWLSGSGIPPASLGEDGDFYLRTANSTVWRKAGGAWSQVADLSGADGATWYTGAGLPAAALGEDGDWYFRTSNAGIYRKVAGAWVFQLDIDGADGATWHAGAGVPAPGLGAVGDFYFRTANGFVYEKTAAAVWTFRRDLTGPQGPKGDKGDKGDPGDSANRGPNVYHYQITLAHFALLQGEPSVLPAALVAIANGATLGDNVHGDWIRFWRPGFNQWWTWIGPDQVWRRAQEWIGAADIAAVRIQAITGNFRDINVSGTLAAEHIDADVRNVKVLWNHSVGIEIDEEGGSITLDESPVGFDYLEFVMQETNPGVSPYGLASIPLHKIHVGATYDDDSAIAFGVAVGAGEASGPTWWIRRTSSTSRTLYMQATHHSLAGNVHVITGVREVDD